MLSVQVRNFSMGSRLRGNDGLWLTKQSGSLLVRRAGQ
jgi:hypothetical protein